MSIAGASLGGWQLPGNAGKPHAGSALAFAGIDDDLLLAVSSAHDTDLSAGFFAGSPWLQGGAFGGDLELEAQLPTDGGLGQEPSRPRGGSDAALDRSLDWRCLSGCAQPCVRCVTRALERISPREGVVGPGDTTFTAVVTPTQVLATS
jgi:hypothetical protein